MWKIVLLLGDIVLLYLSNLTMVTVGYWGVWSPDLFISHLIAFTFLYPFWLALFYMFEWYNVSWSALSLRFQGLFIGGLFVSLLTGFVYFYLNPIAHFTPKSNLVLHLLFFGLFVWFWRSRFFHFMTSRVSPVIACYDSDNEMRSLKDELSRNDPRQWIFYQLATEGRERLTDQIRRLQPTVVILPTRSLREIEIQEIYGSLGAGIMFLDLSQAYELFARRIPLSTIDQSWFVRNVFAREGGVRAALKRVMDVVFAVSVLVLTAPLWAMIALVIKLDSHGSVFYSQTRVGKRRVPFEIKKFRTMRVNAEQDGAQWARVGDRRVTRVGKWLRATHLDELPQMLNVLRGELSLVGPRPERPVFVEELERNIPHYHVRHFIKPGFTGWAQIKFRYARSVTDSQRKFEYDLYYIKNRNLILDTLILLKTVQLLFRRER